MSLLCIFAFIIPFILVDLISEQHMTSKIVGILTLSVFTVVCGLHLRFHSKEQWIVLFVLVFFSFIIGTITNLKDGTKCKDT